jgi:hypothetical protein
MSPIGPEVVLTSRGNFGVNLRLPFDNPTSLFISVTLKLFVYLQDLTRYS